MGRTRIIRGELRRGLNQSNPAFVADVAHRRGAKPVGDPSLHLADMGDAHWSRASQLGTVGDQHGVTRILKYGLGHLNFLIVKVEQCSIALYRGCSNPSRSFDLEPPDKPNSSRPDDAAVGPPKRTTRYNHLSSADGGRAAWRRECCW